jgi:hypothetical protein
LAPGLPACGPVCRAFEQAAQAHGLTHVSRLTANLLRPVPIGDLVIELMTDYVGRNAGHFSAHLMSGDKDVGRFTALVQRESPFEVADGLPGHPLPTMTPLPEEAAAAVFPFAGKHLGYADLVETRAARGRLFNGPCAIWFRLRHPLLQGESPSVYQRVVHRRSKRPNAPARAKNEAKTGHPLRIVGRTPARQAVRNTEAASDSLRAC